MTHNRAALENFLPDDVPSLMLPFAERVLLAPTVTIAEIVSYQKPEPVDNAPDWLLGTFIWRNEKVPMLSLELLMGEAMPPIGYLSRVAVFNYTGLSEDVPFLAVPTVGIPKLTRVSAEELTLQDQATANHFEKARVNLNGDDLVIPEVSALEEAYLTWKQSS